MERPQGVKKFVKFTKIGLMSYHYRDNSSPERISIGNNEGPTTLLTWAAPSNEVMAGLRDP